MSPSQVRASFRDAAGGSWRREEAYRYELARWERSSANTSLPMYANFVFYDGLLTASQFKLDGEASLAHGPKTESTDFVDLTRVATPKGTVVLVARRCCALNESSDWAALKNQWLDG
jgi:hypothetical protein